MFYVYAHINATNGSYFYIGKGCGQRAYVKSHRSNYWKNIVAKYGYIILIIEHDLTETEALSQEKYWIKKLGRKDLKTGGLINFTDGGEGTLNRVVSEKTRQAVALSNKLRPKSEVQKNIVGSRYKGKSGYAHNKSKSVKCIETGNIYGSMSEAERELNLGQSAVSWSIKYKKPIFGMHFEIAA